MPLALNAETTALVLIDLQHSTLSPLLRPYSPSDLVKSSVRLVNAFRAHRASVMFSRTIESELLLLPAEHPFPTSHAVQPADAFDLVGPLEVRTTDVIVTKRQWGAFYATDLEQQLQRRRIRTIVLGGVATNFGVESTARAAFDRGYELVFARDAMSSGSAEMHDFVVENIFTSMGFVRTVDDIVAAWG